MVVQTPKGKWRKKRPRASKYSLGPMGSRLCSIFRQVLASLTFCGPRLGPLALRPGVVLAIFHAFELEPVGIAEEHGVIIVIILSRRIDDRDVVVLEKFLERIDILAATQLESIVME